MPGGGFGPACAELRALLRVFDGAADTRSAEVFGGRTLRARVERRPRGQCEQKKGSKLHSAFVTLMLRQVTHPMASPSA